MRRLLVLLSTILLMATASIRPSSAPAPQRPTFSTRGADLVVLAVSVTDGRGELVRGLESRQFTVLDEGRVQPVAHFSDADTPVSVALVVDDSGSMRAKLGEVFAAALAFARASHPDDELFVVEFNDTVRDALDGRRVEAADVPALEAALRSLRPSGQTALYEALSDGLAHLEGARHSRRVLVLISDGGDNASTTTLRDVLERARDTSTTIYTIGLFDEQSQDQNPDVLRTLADTTGGARFLPRSPGPLLQACERIAREIRQSYTIGYEPPARDGRFHKVRVVVRAPGLKGARARTREGYVADRAETP